LWVIQEAFAYHTKHGNKAIIIGEISKGASHTTRGFPINNEYILNIPYEAPINTMTSKKMGYGWGNSGY